jgi:hypothetical protein
MHVWIGGDLMRGDVHLDGVRVGGHYWNRFGAGLDADLTREQFVDCEVVVSGWIIDPPAGPPRRCRPQYELFRSRVHDALGLTDPVATSPAASSPDDSGRPPSRSAHRSRGRRRPSMFIISTLTKLSYQ